jgi:hypothetical protein
MSVAWTTGVTDDGSVPPGAGAASRSLTLRAGPFTAAEPSACSPENASSGAEWTPRWEELLRVRVLGAVEDVRDRPALDHVAVAHDDDRVRHVGDHAHVVRDEDDAGVDVLAQVPHELEDLGLDRDVEGGRRLVGDEQARAARERLGDHRALALTTGELVRVGAEPARGLRHVHHL